jgi:hypothetical protein
LRQGAILGVKYAGHETLSFSNAASVTTEDPKLEGEPPGEPWNCGSPGGSPSNKTVALRDEPFDSGTP